MIKSLMEFLTAQPVLAGLVGMMLTGAVLFVCRQVPKFLFRRLREIFTVTLVIEGKEEAFGFVTNWLANQDAVKRARNLMLAQLYSNEDRRWLWKVTLGRGWHLLRYAGAWLFVNREVKDAGEIAQLAGTSHTQRLWLITLGRSQHAVRKLIEESKAYYYGEGLVNVHYFSGSSWVCGDRRSPRRLETVFLPSAQKQRIVRDVERFMGSRSAYEDRGIPWRRGYLLKGAPGTGKTSMIFAVAGHFRRPVYSLNLNSIHNDAALSDALNGMDADGILVIEDIDTAKITHDREAVSERQRNAVVVGPVQEKGVTLSGLLNAVDGLAAREGRIMFITSNHADALDPALIRPGRVDVIEEIAPLDRATAAEMVAAFDADQDVLNDIEFPIAAAELQGLLLSRPVPPRLRVVA